MGGPDLGFGDPNPRARRSTPWPSERTGTERETDRGRQTLLGTRPDPTVRCPTRAPGGGHGRRRSAAAKVAAPTAGDGSASFPTGGDQIRPTGGRIRWKEVELSPPVLEIRPSPDFGHCSRLKIERKGASEGRGEGCGWPPASAPPRAAAARTSSGGGGGRRGPPGVFLGGGGVAPPVALRDQATRRGRGRVSNHLDSSIQKLDIINPTNKCAQRYMTIVALNAYKTHET